MISTKEEAQVHLDTGMKYLNERQFQLAWNEFNEIAMGPPFLNGTMKAQGYFGCGAVYVNEGNYSAAIDKFEQALKEDPNYSLARDWIVKCRQAYLSGL